MYTEYTHTVQTAPKITSTDDDDEFEIGPTTARSAATSSTALTFAQCEANYTLPACWRISVQAPIQSRKYPPLGMPIHEATLGKLQTKTNMSGGSAWTTNLSAL